MGSSLWALLFDMKRVERFLVHTVFDLKWSSRKMADFRPKIMLSAFGKYRIFIRIFGAFKQIMKEPAMFLFWFSIPRWIPIVISWKLKNTFLVKNLKKSQGYPLLFFNFWPKIYFWIFRLFRLELIERYEKRKKKRHRLLHNLIEHPKNANEECDFRRMSRASFRVGNSLKDFPANWSVKRAARD